MIKQVCLVGLICIMTGCRTLPSNLSELKGKDKAFVQGSLGTPVVSRTESSNQLWGYRQGECSVLVFFDAADRVQFVDISGTCR